MIRIIGPRDPKVSYAINVTSCSRDLGKNLSPMILGPVVIPNRPLKALRVENAWQYSKVYPEHADSNGDPNVWWYFWSANGFSKPRGERYPKGKTAIPLYCYWNKKKLDYLESRLNVYIPIYAKAARDSGWFKWLEDKYKTDGHITLWDYDGYDYLAEGKTLEDCIRDLSRPLGHAFVLALMLKGMA